MYRVCSKPAPYIRPSKKRDPRTKSATPTTVALLRRVLVGADLRSGNSHFPRAQSTRYVPKGFLRHWSGLMFGLALGLERHLVHSTSHTFRPFGKQLSNSESTSTYHTLLRSLLLTLKYLQSSGGLDSPREEIVIICIVYSRAILSLKAQALWPVTRPEEYTGDFTCLMSVIIWTLQPGFINRISSRVSTE